MLLDVLIPSNGQLSKLQPLLESISLQTLQPDRVVVLIHKVLQKEEQETLLYFLQRSVHPELAKKIILITNLTAEYAPGRGVGYDRNMLMTHAKAKFVWMIDHDNICPENMFAQTADWWTKLKKELNTPLIVSPTILWRNTVKVQSQGITGFSYLIPKYRYGRIYNTSWQQVIMMGGNSLFGLRETFLGHSFDERFTCCYEDVDMTYRVHLSGIPLIVLDKVEIHHMESTKNPLQHLFLGSEKTAYERARNRIRFVKKNATWWQKIQYFGVGLWLQTGWFFVQILIHGGKQRWILLKSVWRGTRDGCRMFDI